MALKGIGMDSTWKKKVTMASERVDEGGGNGEDGEKSLE